MEPEANNPNPERYVTIKNAAYLLGVTPLTLRNWDKSGKFPASRHPLNNYRVYKLSELEAFIANIEQGTAPVRKEEVAVKKLEVKHLHDWERE